MPEKTSLLVNRFRLLRDNRDISMFYPCLLGFALTGSGPKKIFILMLFISLVAVGYLFSVHRIE